MTSLNNIGVIKKKKSEVMKRSAMWCLICHKFKSKEAT